MSVNLVEALENRRHLDSWIANGLLNVYGTSGADAIGVYQIGDRIDVWINGRAKSFSANSFRKLDVRSGPGDDYIELGVGVYNVRVANQVMAGMGNDTILGSDAANVITGESGADSIRGAGGNDTIHGGDGNDTIVGETGNDLIVGGYGADDLWGSRGYDEIHGGAGDDSLRGGDDGDILYGDDGKDTLLGDDGDDAMYGGADDDVLDSVDDTRNEDTVRGDSGDDDLYVNHWSDDFEGGSGSDRFFDSRDFLFPWPF